MLPASLSRHYGAITFFNTILHNVFLLYHVETFVSVYKIDKASFWIGETIFLLWNSFNDPLFGWISDKKYLTSTAVSSICLFFDEIKSNIHASSQFSHTKLVIAFVY